MSENHASAPEPISGRRPTGESLAQVERILRRNRALLRGTATASRQGEEEVGVGYSVCSDPQNGVTRGDFSND